MAKEVIDVLTDSLIVAEANGIPAYRLVDFEGNLAESGEAAYGVSTGGRNKGLSVSVGVMGIHLVELEESATKGQLLAAGTDGKAAVATDGDDVAGYAMEAGSAGDVIRIVMHGRPGDTTAPFLKKISVTHESDAELWTIPAGHVFEKVFAKVTTAFASTGTLEAVIGDGDGTSGTDKDGYLDLDSVSAGSWKGLNASERGALLWDDTEDAQIDDVFETDGTLYFTKDDDMNAGEMTLYIKGYRIS